MAGSNCECPLFLLCNPRRRFRPGMPQVMNSLRSALSYSSDRDSHLQQLSLPVSMSSFQCVSFLILHSVHRNKNSQAAETVGAGRDALFEVFERLETFFQRLELYTETAFNQDMMDIITKIMVEVLSILGIATKEIRQGRTSKSLPCKCVAVDRTFLRKIS